MTTTPAADQTIPHQALVETVIDARIEANQDSDEAAFAAQGTAVITAPTAPGGTYSQAEAASAKTAIDAIRAALTASGITN